MNSFIMIANVANSGDVKKVMAPRQIYKLLVNYIPRSTFVLPFPRPRMPPQPLHAMHHTLLAELCSPPKFQDWLAHLCLSHWRHTQMLLDIRILPPASVSYSTLVARWSRWTLSAP